MDVRKYAALNDIFVDNPFGMWRIIGFLEADGRYHSLRNWKDIGKKDATAIKGIDKFKAGLDHEKEKKHEGHINSSALELVDRKRH